MRIMVVEDEHLLREGLVKMIGRMNVNGKVVASASNGKEAMELLPGIGVDLIITDIRMPIIDGLQLLEHVATQYPHIRSIILSGYNDFEYAKKAMKLGCKDYLLKPPHYAEFHDLLSQVSAEFEQDRSQRLDDYKNRQMINRNQYVIRQEFLRNMTYRRAVRDVAEMLDTSASLGMPLQAADYRVLAIRFDGLAELKQRFGPKDWELMKFAMHNVTEEVLASSPCFYDDHECLVALSDACGSEQQAVCAGMKIQTVVSELLKLPVSVGISEPASLSSLSEAYEEACRLLKYRLVSDQKIVKTAGGTQETGGESAQPLTEQLTKVFELEQPELIATTLKAWCLAVQRATLSLDAIERLDEQLKVFLLSAFRHYAKELEKDSPLADQKVAIEALEFADSFHDKLMPVFRILADLQRRSNNGKVENRTVEQAMKWIREHYKDNITLHSIAEQVYLNPAYLSVMFKKKTGKSIIEFLTEVRLDEAKKPLVQTDLKAYQIAEMVGFNDVAYFSNLFKKRESVAPQEYRKLHV